MFGEALGVGEFVGMRTRGIFGGVGRLVGDVGDSVVVAVGQSDALRRDDGLFGLLEFDFLLLELMSNEIAFDSVALGRDARFLIRFCCLQIDSEETML